MALQQLTGQTKKYKNAQAHLSKELNEFSQTEEYQKYAYITLDEIEAELRQLGLEEKRK